MSKRITKAIAGAAVGMLAWTAPALAAGPDRQALTVIIRVAPDATSCLAIASGPISGVGSCVLDQQGHEEATLHVALPNGTFNVVVTTVSDDSHFNPQACTFRFTDTETFTIAGGTGAYLSATGSGTGTSRGFFTMPHSAGGCDRS